MREQFANRTFNFISKYNSYTEFDEIKIKYGLEVLYTMVTKTTGILLISFLLNIFKETIVLMMFYSVLRLFSHGIHASKSLHCWIVSIICYAVFPLLIKYFVIKKSIIIFIWVLSFIFFIICYPADTPKKPIINKKKRMFDKISTLIISFILLVIIILYSNTLINNSIFYALIMSIIAINPLTYKLFGIQYNNYKKYLNT